MHSPKKVLLIDREPGITRVVRQALEKAGKYLVHEQRDDNFSIDAARAFQPDLILLDVAAKSIASLTLERRIQTDTVLRKTPLAHLSGLKSETEIMSGGILTGHSFFTGPIGTDDVIRGVEQLLTAKATA
jgi:DNA-binding response OmpR family regulator